MTWKVERWGGNSNHKRRIVFRGKPDAARAKFHKIREALRQGLVELIDESNGAILDRCWAPRLRTRW